MSNFIHSLVHDRVQSLDEVKIYFIAIIPNACFPPRNGARERAHAICSWPGEPGHAGDGENFGNEGGGKDDVSQSVWRGGEWVPAGIECFFEELVDDVKVIPECRRSDFAKVFDEDVQKGADERKGIEWIDFTGSSSTYKRIYA